MADIARTLSYAAQIVYIFVLIDKK
jgi:hypothetical protein